jgi:flagellar basal-body rod modification protein FlgD
MTSPISGNDAAKQSFLNSQARKPESKEEENALGREAFLTMMIAQLKNQDPLNPADGTEYTTQLAQFSSLEQQINQSGTLTELKEMMDKSNDRENIFQFVGKDILTDGNPIKIEDGAVLGGFFSMEKASDYTEIAIKDSLGEEVRRLDLGALPAGSHNSGWAGLDDEGEPLPDGEYEFEVFAKNKEGFIDIATMLKGQAVGVIYNGATPYLQIEDGKGATGKPKLRVVDPKTVLEVGIHKETEKSAEDKMAETMAEARAKAGSPNPLVEEKSDSEGIPESALKAALEGIQGGPDVAKVEAGPVERIQKMPEALSAAAQAKMVQGNPAVVPGQIKAKS